MKADVRAFAEDIADAYELMEPVVEIGSRAAEGQEDIADLRPILGAETYIGCDIQEGFGVDRIEDVHALSFEDDSVGTIISLETLEHVANPLRAVQEMHRVLRPGGLLAISSVMFFPIHAHPWDYWRFTPEGFALLLEPFESSMVLARGFDLLPESVFGVGVKGPAKLDPTQLARISKAVDNWGHGQPVDFGPIRMTVRDLWRHTLRETGAAVRRRVQRPRG